MTQAATVSSRGTGTSRALPTLLTALLILAAVAQVLAYVDTTQGRRIGIDFYQYWGVGQATRLTDGAVRNPYLQQAGFNRVLTQEAARSADPVYRKVAAYRSDLELQGTPMAYFVFSLFPSDYRQALDLHLVLQVCAFVAAVVLLLQRLQRPVAYCLLAALLLVPFYRPFFSDLLVANYNAILLLGLAIALRATEKLAGSQASGNDGQWPIAVLGGCSLLAVGSLSLLKPSLAPATLAIGLLLLARLGLRGAIPAIGLGGALLVVLACLPMLHFGTPAIWTDWLHYFGNSNLDMFDLPFEKGNVSVPLFLSERTGYPFGVTATLLAAVVLLTFILAVRRQGSLFGSIQTGLAEPWLAISLGITMFFAISPLAWVHYHVLLLAPGLILLDRSGYSRPEAYVAFLGLFLAAAGPVHFLPLMEVDEGSLVPIYGIMISWPVLWIATLLTIRRAGARPDAANASTAGTGKVSDQ